jgi:hypothetical protein
LFIECEAYFSDQNGGLITAIATIFIAAFTLTLWRSTNTHAGHMEQMVSVQRAFISVTEFIQELAVASDNIDNLNQFSAEAIAQMGDLNLRVTRFAVMPQWRNSGNTPTVNMRARVDWLETDVRDINEVGTYRGGEDRIFVAPHSETLGEVVEMPGLGSLIQGGLPELTIVPLMLIWGRADYDDIFGKSHFIEWCYRVRPENHRGERLRVSFIQWGNYNRSDEDT